MVGEEIMPGVTLAEVGFDGVTIDRAGTREQIFLDQSEPAAPVAGAPGQTPAVTVPVPVPAAPPAAAPTPFQFAPRVSENQITGLIVSPGGDGGQMFRAAGFQAGDVVTEVNGQRVVSAQQAEAMLRAAAGNANVTVERGGRVTQIRVRF
jgi:general secretion pathway protein C